MINVAIGAEITMFLKKTNIARVTCAVYSDFSDHLQQEGQHLLTEQRAANFILLANH